MQSIEKTILRAIDKAVEEDAEDRRRKHLGASILGRRCIRAVYYSWRWFYTEAHTGRLLRLFDRGQLEEARFSAYLTRIGFEVRSHAERLVYHAGSDSFFLQDWEAPVDFSEVEDLTGVEWAMRLAKARKVVNTQIRVASHNGHFGGSLDGEILPPPELQVGPLADGWGVPEYKTHGEKSFKILVEKGLQTAKIEHYIQMQVYMHLRKRTWGLYLAVNKNTDDLHIEVVQYREEIAAAYLDRAKGVIFADQPPERITTNPSWWECKFCEFREICHKDAKPQVNCRTCVYSRPSDDPARQKEWVCARFNGVTIPPDFTKKGCADWEAIK